MRPRPPSDLWDRPREDVSISGAATANVHLCLFQHAPVRKVDGFEWPGKRINAGMRYANLWRFLSRSPLENVVCRSQ